MSGYGQRLGFQAGEVYNLAGVFDVYADDALFGIQVYHDARRDLKRVGAGAISEIDIEGVCIRVVVELHRSAIQ